MSNHLVPGQHILDPTQSLDQGIAVAAMLEEGVDAGPTNVICRGWVWREAPMTLVLLTTDN